MAPTKEKGRKLREHIDDTSVKLGHAEKFLNEVLDVPFDKYPNHFKRFGLIFKVVRQRNGMMFCSNAMILAGMVPMMNSGPNSDGSQFFITKVKAYCPCLSSLQVAFPPTVFEPMQYHHY
nr:formin-like protein 1 [Tanacetum cinerariifolium]